MTKILSKHEYKKLAIEAFKNGLRLHFDSIYLFNKGSYPSSLQLSIISLEEFSKSNWVEHYYWTSITNTGFPDAEFEQEWLRLLYQHPKKQRAFFGWGLSREYSPKFIKSIENNELELLKQNATYVGLRKEKNNIDIESRISIPNKISKNEAKKMISMINDYLKDVCERKILQDGYYNIDEKDDLITNKLYSQLKKWKYKTGLRSNKWFKEWMNTYNKVNTKSHITSAPSRPC